MAEYASKASDAVKEGWKVAQDKAGKAAEATNQAVSTYVVGPVNKGVTAIGDAWKAGVPPEILQMWKDKLSQVTSSFKSAGESANAAVTEFLGKLKLELFKYVTETTLQYAGAGLLGCGTLYLGGRLLLNGKSRKFTAKSRAPFAGNGNGIYSLRRQLLASETISARVPAMKVAMKQLGLSAGDSVLVVMHAIEAAEVQTWCTASQVKAVFVDSSEVPTTDFIKDYVVNLRPKVVFYDVSLIDDVVKVEAGARAENAEAAEKITWIFAATSFPQKGWALDRTASAAPHMQHKCYLDWSEDAVKAYDRAAKTAGGQRDENVIEALVNNVNQNVQSLSKLFTPQASPEKPPQTATIDALRSADVAHAESQAPAAYQAGRG
eukprot:CAMPEP_0196729084 /NCGR_PEP_ID=MMETSP1091-20130531/9566_1 /TAXON_ID=302021 /ORGANISM="Rhodomonas sp., Strain CCMP768" /LENGTH=377 /DNA_ID=CAMNT_0042071915 /DNA_START=27 /DNA_END=1157 /DNA_ORIENTATION=-